MSLARVTWIGGPVLRARMEGPFSVHEALAVGPDRLLGEVIQLRGDELVAQVYEDTTGLAPGTRVDGTGHALSVALGPTLLGGIYDGLLRPLTIGADWTVRPGAAAIGATVRPWTPGVSNGDNVRPGATLGTVSGARPQRVLVPPGVGGRLEQVAPAGDYAEDAPLAVCVDGDGRRTPLAMRQTWPVRTPRPVAARLPAAAPMITGQRIIDPSISARQWNIRRTARPIWWPRVPATARTAVSPITVGSLPTRPI